MADSRKEPTPHDEIVEDVIGKNGLDIKFEKKLFNPEDVKKSIKRSLDNYEIYSLIGRIKMINEVYKKIMHDSALEGNKGIAHHENPTLDKLLNKELTDTEFKIIGILKDLYLELAALIIEGKEPNSNDEEIAALRADLDDTNSLINKKRNGGSSFFGSNETNTHKKLKEMLHKQGLLDVDVKKVPTPKPRPGSDDL